MQKLRDRFRSALRRRLGVVLLGCCAGLIAVAAPARGLTINATFGTSITNLSNAGLWEGALNYADAQMAANFSDPITINITFQSNPGTSILGQSGAPIQSIGNYAALKTTLAADSKTADDVTSVAHLPTIDPTNGSTFYATTAQAKALGIRSANNSGNDGTVTMGTGYNYTFDPANRAVAGDFDFIGTAEHEITEVMGRYGDANLGGVYGPLDMFGYQFAAGGTGTGTLNLAQNQDNNYFSIDGGATALKLYNNHSNGEDDKDWGVGSNDSFNAYSDSGVENNMSVVDLREMDVIGYDRVLPEPACLATLAVAAVTLLRRRR